MSPARTNSKLNSDKSRAGSDQSRAGTQNSKLKLLVPLLLDWFSRNARDLPWRRTRDPYAIWVSEIMLQQTQVKTVVPYWERWLHELPAIPALARASSEKIHKLWEGLGYYTRVRNLQKAALSILEKHGGKFPEKFDDVLELPGIGRYTAGAICSIAFNQPTPILDGNVIRVLTRIFGIGQNPREKETNARLWELATRLVAQATRLNPSRSSRREAAHSKIRNSQNLLASAATSKDQTPHPCSALNQSLMELGALVCTPRQPECGICPAKSLCCAFRENRTEQLPSLGKRAAATGRRFAAFVLKRQGRYLVRQRPAGGVNAHLWEFPNAELSGVSDLRKAARNSVGFTPETFVSMVTIKHSITRYRITLDAFAITGKNGNSARTDGLWLTPSELKKLSFPSAHKKIIAHLDQLD